MGYHKVERPSVPLISKVTLSKEFHELLIATMNKSVLDLVPGVWYPTRFLRTMLLFNYYFLIVDSVYNHSTKDKRFAQFYNNHTEVMFCLSYTLKSCFDISFLIIISLSKNSK